MNLRDTRINMCDRGKGAALRFLVFFISINATIAIKADTVYFTYDCGVDVAASGGGTGTTGDNNNCGGLCFDCPRISALAVDPNAGTVYAATPDGITKNTYTTNQLFVGGLAVPCLITDSSGNLYALTGDGTVYKISPSGDVSLFANLPGAVAIAFDKNGSLYSAAGTNVSKTMAGSTSAFGTLVGQAVGKGLVVDSVGNVVVDTSIGIERLTPDGAGGLYFRWTDASCVAMPWGTPINLITGAGATGICIDESDNLYFCANYCPDRCETLIFKYVPGASLAGWTNAYFGTMLSTALACGPLPAVSSILLLDSGTSAPQLVAQPQSQTVSGQGTASFAVTAIGSPLNYQWLFNGTNIAGATASTLTISGVKQSDLGLYSVAVTNVLGSVVSSNAVLSMFPFIVGPFKGAVGYWGKPVAFGIQAWGTGPLTYQWFKDGVLLPSGTNQTFTLTSAQFADAGFYSVVVSSALGSATNPPTQLAINPANVAVGMYAGIIIDGRPGKKSHHCCPRCPLLFGLHATVCGCENRPLSDL
jgi:hypothetical protein